MASGGAGRGVDELGAAVFEAASAGDVSGFQEAVRFKRAGKIKGSLSWRDPFNRTPLLAAAAGGHTEMVRLLVEEYGVNVEESKCTEFTGEEFTPLVYAANVGHHETVALLLKNGANVDHAYPLHRACFADSTENLKCVELLVGQGADINRKFVGGRNERELVHESTALGVACEQLCSRTVDYLLHKGANPNIADKHGNLPMHTAFSAVWNSHSEIRCRNGCVKDGEKIITLLTRFGTVQTRNAMGLTPVMIGALTGNLVHVAEWETLFSLEQGAQADMLALLASHFLLRDEQERGVAILRQLCSGPPTERAGNAEVTCPYGDFHVPQSLEDLASIQANSLYLKVVALVMRERLLTMEGKKKYMWQALRDFADNCPLTTEGKTLAFRALKHECSLEVEANFFCGFAVECLFRLADPSQIPLRESLLEEVVILFKLAAIQISPDVTQMTVEDRREAIAYHRHKSTSIIKILARYANYPPLSDYDKDFLLMFVGQYVLAYDMVSEIIKREREAEERIFGDICSQNGSSGDGNKKTGWTILHSYYAVLSQRRAHNDHSVEERLVTFLLKCGVDPFLPTKDGYSALHFLVKSCPSPSQTDSFRKGVVVPLVEWGSPILQRNPETGRNMIDDCCNEDTKRLLEDLTLPSLLKLCTRFVHRHHIPYLSVLPAPLHGLLEMNV